MSHVLAFSVRLDDEIWKRLELYAIAQNVHEDLKGIHKSRIINNILDKNLPKTAGDLPGSILDENTPAGRWHMAKEKCTDDYNTRKRHNI